jgi:hypothetical protein
METWALENITIYFDPEEKDTAEIIKSACEGSIQIVRESWGLAIPVDCRVYVMTSWSQFLFHSAPWHWKVLLTITFPLWVTRVRRMWRVAGGWMQRYGRRCAVGVKPSRLVELSDRSIGERIFVEDESLEHKVQLVTCHELTHAFTAHLKLPMWLNEGLAMVTVDKFSGKLTVKEETLKVFQTSTTDKSPGRYQDVSVRDKDALVYHTVRGYWITRYFEDTKPDLLKEILRHRYSHKELETKVASAYDMRRDTFWEEIDAILVEHFLTNRRVSI